MARKSSKNNYKYYSERYLIAMVGTKSLTKLMEYANHEQFKYPIGAYLYFNKPNRLSEYVHKELVELMNEFEYYHKRPEENEKHEIKNRYSEVYGWITHLSIKSFKNEDSKKYCVKEILKIIDGKNIPLTHVSKDLDISYHILYRVLRKGEVNKISFDRIWQLRSEVRKRYGSKQ